MVSVRGAERPVNNVKRPRAVYFVGAVYPCSRSVGVIIFSGSTTRFEKMYAQRAMKVWKFAAARVRNFFRGRSREHGKIITKNTFVSGKCIADNLITLYDVRRLGGGGDRVRVGIVHCYARAREY